MPDGHGFEPEEAHAAPPHSIDAEQALLGALLYDNEVYHRVSEIVRAEHFYEPSHARIFETLAQSVARGELADAITLAGFADADAGLQDLGGRRYLAELTAAHVSGPAARDYARIVHDLAMRRELVRISGEIQTHATADHDTPARALIEDAERNLFSLAEVGAPNRGFASFDKVLVNTIHTVAAAYERGGGISGVATGLSDLDRQLGGLHASDLIILAGRPSMGKTSLATNIALNIARRCQRERDENGETKTVEGGVVGFFSLEMSSEQLALRLLAEVTEISGHNIRRGDLEPRDFEEIRDAATELASMPLHIDDTGGLSIAQLATRARRLKRTVGLDVIVVDYLQLVTPASSRSDGRVQEVSEITQGLKALAKELNVPVIALSQLSRQVEQRDDKRPQLSDLRESGSIEQDADVVMFVYREEYYVARREPKSKQGTDEYFAWEEELQRVAGRAEIIIGKQRHGPIGTVEVAFDGRVTKFSDLVEEAPQYAPAIERGPSPAAPGGPSLKRTRTRAPERELPVAPQFAAREDARRGRAPRAEAAGADDLFPADPPEGDPPLMCSPFSVDVPDADLFSRR